MSWTTGIRTQRLIRRNNKRGNARFHWGHVAQTKPGRLMHGSQGPAIAYGREKALVSVQQTCSSWTYSAEGGTTKAASVSQRLKKVLDGADWSSEASSYTAILIAADTVSPAPP
ncbi:hypothetical protein ATANTOWER_015733 [Ataeniobius toweri]|uniref:Uncharacterized protein n=1 Tax=Ataeniobius toweri TaxID=208326 RepID=A0ABU7B721_9TELE|nr:hypothetical protein [Ataeniobius toweri]